MLHNVFMIPKMTSETPTQEFSFFIFWNLVVGIFRAFENMRDIKYMRDICDMLYGGTCFCILLIYPIYREKYDKISSIKYLKYLTPNLK